MDVCADFLLISVISFETLLLWHGLKTPASSRISVRYFYFKIPTNRGLHWTLQSSRASPNHYMGGTTKQLHEASALWLTLQYLIKTLGISFVPSFPLLTFYLTRAYMDLILNGEKRPPSFKKLPSCLYDESLADPNVKHSGYLRGKALERVCFFFDVLPF